MGFVDYARAAFAELLKDLIMRYRLSDHSDMLLPLSPESGGILKVATTRGESIPSGLRTLAGKFGTSPSFSRISSARGRRLDSLSGCAFGA
jgi:hypothetical protein